MSEQLGFSFYPDSAQNFRKSPASPVGVRPRQGTGTTMASMHPARSYKGRAGEESCVGTRGGILWKSNRGIEMCRQCGRGSPGWKSRMQVRGVENWITDDPRVGGCLGVLSRTCAGRHAGTPAISWTPYTPSVSQLCSTFTWPQ